MNPRTLIYGNVRALAGRLTGVTRWLLRHPAARGLPVGYFGAGAAAAAALWAAPAEPRLPVAANACQDGRPDLAWPQLGYVLPPTLLIVGSAGEVVLGLNRQARQQLSCESELAVIPGAARPASPEPRTKSPGWPLDGSPAISFRQPGGSPNSGWPARPIPLAEGDGDGQPGDSGHGGGFGAALDRPQHAGPLDGEHEHAGGPGQAAW